MTKHRLSPKGVALRMRRAMEPGWSEWPDRKAPKVSPIPRALVSDDGAQLDGFLLEFSDGTVFAVTVRPLFSGGEE